MVSSTQVMNAQDANAPLRDVGKKDEEREEEVEYSPFFGIEKGLVLQESRVFHDSHLDSRKCQQVITKLLYLINQGESLTKVQELPRVMSWTSTHYVMDGDEQELTLIIVPTGGSHRSVFCCDQVIPGERYWIKKNGVSHNQRAVPVSR
mmetsp:Transcript_7706/g.47697  ORF Transcript_7706/g.47697 Transcript_7706/m.47697 type:complete len:149 (-) Transcript_7706:2814-3260(-)